ncbi:unnamed protein product [Musa textilis]
MGSACQWDGTLSPNDFNYSAAAFCERWKEVNDSLPQWLWVPFPVAGDSSCNAAGYLTMENVYHQNASEEVSHEESILGDEELSDDATVVQSCGEDDVHVYDYHIVYSFNFRVPVLYFRGYRLAPLFAFIFLCICHHHYAKRRGGGELSSFLLPDFPKSTMQALKKYSPPEISLHTSKKDCWVSIHGKVYDVTTFLEDHPGGEDVILHASAGGDATQAFEDVGHSSTAISMMEGYVIGTVEGHASVDEPSKPVSGPQRLQRSCHPLPTTSLTSSCLCWSLALPLQLGITSTSIPCPRLKYPYDG